MSTVLEFVSGALWGAIATVLVWAALWLLSDLFDRWRAKRGRVPFVDAAWESMRGLVETLWRLAAAGCAREPRHRRAGAARWSR